MHIFHTELYRQCRHRICVQYTIKSITLHTDLPYKSYFRNAQLCCTLIMPNFSKGLGSWAPLYASMWGSRWGSRLGSWLGSWSWFPVTSWFLIRFNKTCIKLSYNVLQYVYYSTSVSTVSTYITLLRYNVYSTYLHRMICS